MSFVPRRIDVTFELGEGAFGLTGANKVKLTGLRVSTRIENAGGRVMGSLQGLISGMTLSQINELSTLGLIATNRRKNVITIEAGDLGGQMSAVFKGQINNGYGYFDANAQANAFVVSALSGFFDAVAPAKPSSVAGGADVAQLLSGLATQMNCAFENNGVKKTLHDSYYDGTAFSQAARIVRDAGIEWNACYLGTLAIWNPGENRGGQVPVISSDTGMMGYPGFTSSGVQVSTQFNPSLRVGGQVRITSKVIGSQLARAEQLASASPAAGTNNKGLWTIMKLDLALDAQVPRGKWESIINAIPAGIQGPFVP